MSFLSDYIHFTSGNEANPNYHLWCGLAALSSIVSRRVWVPQGYYNAYPNLYIILAGPPGNKKTTSMNIAKALVRTIGDIPFSAECQTKESLVRELATKTRFFHLPGVEKPIYYTPMSIFVTELSQFLGPNSGHMIDFLTTVYDADVYDLKTKNKGDDIIQGPFITLLACTTPDWITTYLKTDIITGGFTRRAVFVLEYVDGEPIAFPCIKPSQREAWDRAVEYSKLLLEVSGEFTWDKDAEVFYTAWYEENYRKLPNDPATRGYYRTKHMQLLKVSMLLALSEEAKLRLSLQNIKDGLDVLERTEKNLPKVFQAIGRNELNAISTKLVELLEMNGTAMLEKKICSMMWAEANGQEIYSIINHLVETERVVKLKEERINQPPRYWLDLPGRTRTKVTL